MNTTSYDVGQPYRYISQSYAYLIVTCAHSERFSHSENRPVPTIAQFEKDQKQRQDGEDEPIPEIGANNERLATESQNQNTGAKEKEEIMKRSLGKDLNPAQKAEEQRKKGPRSVKDPVTGQEIVVRDARFEGAFLPVQFLVLKLLFQIIEPSRWTQLKHRG